MQVEHRDAEGKVTRALNLARPWRRARYRDLVCEVAGVDWFSLTSEERRQKCREFGVEIQPQMADFEVTQHVFEKLVEENFRSGLCHPLPEGIGPLARQNLEDDSLVDVFELIINGQEIAPWLHRAE